MINNDFFNFDSKLIEAAAQAAAGKDFLKQRELPNTTELKYLRRLIITK